MGDAPLEHDPAKRAQGGEPPVIDYRSAGPSAPPRRPTSVIERLFALAMSITLVALAVHLALVIGRGSLGLAELFYPSVLLSLIGAALCALFALGKVGSRRE